MGTRVVLVKPPDDSRLNFGTFSLGVLGASIRCFAKVSILDLTNAHVDEAVRCLTQSQADVIGITVMSLVSVKPAAAFVRKLRTSLGEKGEGRRVLVLAGGHGATMTPAILIEAGADAVVLGEGEETLEDIVKKGIRPGMPGVVCRSGDGLITGPIRPSIRPLGRLPLPARDLMPYPPGGVHLMETSRGCPHACAFCETTRFYGRNWRPHSPERVAAEVRLLVERFGAWMIHFSDDNFAADPKRVLRICDELKRGPLPACILASARADDLLASPCAIPAMAAASILRVTVGVETLTPGTAAMAGKRIPLETYRKAFGRMREHGIFSVASFIVGIPGEKREERKRVVELASEAGPDSASFLPFLPFPGVPLASGRRQGYQPKAADARFADLCTRAFFAHPTVKSRLEEAVCGKDMRSLFARATLDHRFSEWGHRLDI